MGDFNQTRDDKNAGSFDFASGESSSQFSNDENFGNADPRFPAAASDDGAFGEASESHDFGDGVATDFFGPEFSNGDFRSADDSERSFNI